jgi:two-component system, sensor histidine kinase and response regulator
MNDVIEREIPHILIVDDNPANITLISSHIKKQGYEYSVATNGSRALELAEELLPDLILLDVMMPGMSGFEVIEKLKENEKTKIIPVIFLTAATGQEDMVKGFHLGAVDYITKPFNASELYARVRTHLQLQPYQRRINQDNIVLERLNNEKNEILGIVAHDLKNPIYNISMLAKLILGDKNMNRDDIEEYSSDIIFSTEKMLQLIMDLLDVNAIATGKIYVHIEEYNIIRIISEVASLFTERAKKKDITLHWHPEDTIINIQTDSRALLHILDNIVSNAVKYTFPGKNIFIDVNRTNKEVVIAVKDEGPGFSESDKEMMFSRYQKLSAQPTGGEHSSGLGLSIVKKYVELINAKIELDTVFGVGSTFYIKLPLI